jgi:hypothetical protein
MAPNGPNSLYGPIWAYIGAVLGLYMGQIAYIGLYWPINGPKIALFLAQKPIIYGKNPLKKGPKMTQKWPILTPFLGPFLGGFDRK